jgi:Flp pilus assembly protein TadD
MGFAPGAIAATFVGSGARTFQEPPPTWVPSGDALNRSRWFGGSAESLVGDLIREGATGVAGYVSQPVLRGTIRPQILFPAYFKGLSLVEAFYLAMPVLSWQTVVVGDPLCAPFRGETLSRGDIEDGVDPVTELPALFSRRRVDGVMGANPGVPEDAAALGIRADNLASRGDAEGARAAVDEALQLAPQFVPTMTLGAMLDERAGRHDEAIEAYRRILEVDPNNVTALNNLAYSIGVRQGKPMEGLPFARRAVTASPSNPTVLDTLAWIQHLLGDDAAAAKLMDQVVRANTLNPELRLHAAIIYAAVGQRGQAGTQLKIALQLNPSLADSPEVKELLAQLAPASR